jgi:hypothetical protein
MSEQDRNNSSAGPSSSSSKPAIVKDLLSEVVLLALGLNQHHHDEAEDTRECVGSLLIPSHDLQELSALTHSHNTSVSATTPPAESHLDVEECLTWWN